jgi:hypothetical protein
MPELVTNQVNEKTVMPTMPRRNLRVRCSREAAPLLHVAHWKSDYFIRTKKVSDVEQNSGLTR